MQVLAAFLKPADESEPARPTTCTTGGVRTVIARVPEAALCLESGFLFAHTSRPKFRNAHGEMKSNLFVRIAEHALTRQR
jgi:hypothetical protein